MKKLYGKETDVLEDSAYIKETLIAKQLQMLCPDEFIQQYFVGEGTNKIKARLEQYYTDDSAWKEEIDNLFDRIEDGFLLRKNEREENFKSGIHSSIQHTLLSALDSKLEQDMENGKFNSEEEIEEYMQTYSKNILTAENLNLDEICQKKFPGLQIASKRFEDIKNRNKQRFILREQQEQENKKYLEEIESQNEGKVQDIPMDEATTEIKELNNTENQRQENTVIKNNITPQQIEQATENVTISSINNEATISENVMEVPVIGTPVIE